MGNDELFDTGDLVQIILRGQVHTCVVEDSEYNVSGEGTPTLHCIRVAHPETGIPMYFTLRDFGQGTIWKYNPDIHTPTRPEPSELEFNAELDAMEDRIRNLFEETTRNTRSLSEAVRQQVVQELQDTFPDTTIPADAIQTTLNEEDGRVDVEISIPAAMREGDLRGYVPDTIVMDEAQDMPYESICVIEERLQFPQRPFFQPDRQEITPELLEVYSICDTMFPPEFLSAPIQEIESFIEAAKLMILGVMPDSEPHIGVEWHNDKVLIAL